MYKTEEVKMIRINLDPDSIDMTCGACPTIFDFKDTEGTSYYFRLRNGVARISLDATEEHLIAGEMGGNFDGVCSWEDVVKWAADNNVLIA